MLHWRSGKGFSSKLLHSNAPDKRLIITSNRRQREQRSNTIFRNFSLTDTKLSYREENKDKKRKQRKQLLKRKERKQLLKRKERKQLLENDTTRKCFAHKQRTNKHLNALEKYHLLIFTYLLHL